MTAEQQRHGSSGGRIAATAVVAVLMVLVLLIIASVFGQQQKPRPQTYREMLEQRPAPSLEGLVERAAPDRVGDDTIEAFHDLLKLRELADPQAVPTLIKILESHRDSTRIHGFAAAQALFTADTAEAHEALRTHLLDPGYAVDLAIGYTSHWQMREPQRSEMIRRYLLQDLSEPLDITVEPRWRADDDERVLVVTVRLTNRSERPLSLANWQIYQASHLYFIAPSGRVLPSVELVRHNAPMPEYELLQPKESRAYGIELMLRSDETQKERLRDPQAKAAILTRDVGFPLREFGAYRVYAMLHQRSDRLKQLNEREWQRMHASHWWTGRAVSPAATVQVKPTDAGQINGL